MVLQHLECLIVGEEIKKIISKQGKHLSVHTPIKIKVEQVLKGDLTVGGMIKINQQGGTYENVYYKIEGNKIYKNSQTYVFFLTKRDFDTEQEKKDYKENFYLSINPFQDQLRLKNNNV